MTVTVRLTIEEEARLWKEFTVTLAESVQPSGSLVECPDGPFPMSAS